MLYIVYYIVMHKENIKYFRCFGIKYFARRNFSKIRVREKRTIEISGSVVTNNAICSLKFSSR